MTSRQHLRRGMTLVELLVVVMILGLMAAATAPLLSSTAGRRGREAAATLATMTTRANTYARQLGNSNTYAGLYLMPVTPRDPSAASQPEDLAWGIRPPAASVDLAVAETVEPYTGDASNLKAATCIYQYPAVPNRRRRAIFAIRKQNTATLPYRINNVFPTLVTLPDRSPVSAIRMGSTPSAQILSQAAITDASLFWFIEATALQTNDTFDTLVGPVDPLVGGKEFEITLPPVQALPAPLTMVGEYVVDTAWCTCGSRIFQPITDPMPLGVNNRFAGLPYFDLYGPVMLLFSSSGDLRSIAYNQWDPAGYAGANKQNVSDNVYLLVGKVDRVGLPYSPTPTDRAPGANWQYSDSRWVRISARDGAVLIADPVPNATDVFTSQGYARRGLSATRL
jgi:prepilin-type N-terminal cleavage/methylation domain-containing protein